MGVKLRKGVMGIVCIYFLLLAGGLSSCKWIAEDVAHCPQTFRLFVRALDAEDQDITSTGEVEEVLLFMFDQEGKLVERVILSAEEVKHRKEVYIEHFGPKKLTFLAVGNPSPAERMRLLKASTMEEVRLELKLENGYAHTTTDLFAGRLERAIIYGTLNSGENATIDIRRVTARVTLTVLGYEAWLKRQGYLASPFDPTDSSKALISFGTSADKYAVSNGIYEGTPTTYRILGHLAGAYGDFHSKELRVFPLMGGDSFILKFHVNGQCIEHFTQDDNGQVLLPVVGKHLNVLIDFRSAQASISIKVTPWNVVHQFVIY